MIIIIRKNTVVLEVVPRLTVNASRDGVARSIIMKTTVRYIWYHSRYNSSERRRRQRPTTDDSGPSLKK